jgi:hypothetical protein
MTGIAKVDPSLNSNWLPVKPYRWPLILIRILPKGYCFAALDTGVPLCPRKKELMTFSKIIRLCSIRIDAYA